MIDTVEKVVSDPPKRNNRIRTASYLNRNCVRGRDFESMLRIRGRKIVFQQYRPKADIASSPNPFKWEVQAGTVSVLSGREQYETCSSTHSWKGCGNWVGLTAATFGSTSAGPEVVRTLIVDMRRS